MQRERRKKPLEKGMVGDQNRTLSLTDTDTGQSIGSSRRGDLLVC